MNVLSWAASAVLGSQTTTPGAIDIVAIRHTDGKIDCSPFHVKFTSKGRDRSKVVKLKVRDKLTPVVMKLGPAGEAFFVEQTPPENIRKDSRQLSTDDCGNQVPPFSSSESASNSRFRSRSLGDIDGIGESTITTMRNGPTIQNKLEIDDERRTDVDRADSGLRRERSKSEITASDLSILSSVATQFSIQWCEARKISDPSDGIDGSRISKLNSDQRQNDQGIPASPNRPSNTVWTWTWGDLPVKSGARKGNKLAKDIRLPLSRPNDANQQIEPHLTGDDRDVLELSRFTQVDRLNGAEARDDPCSILEQRENGYSFGYHDIDNYEPDREISDNRLLDYRIFSLCGHILAHENGAPEPVPANTVELRNILSSYALRASEMSVSLITDPTVVTILDDFLLPVGVAFLLLETVKSQHCDANLASLYDYSMTQDIVNRALEEYVSCVVPPGQPLTPHLPVWAGQRISTWGSGSHNSFTSSAECVIDSDLAVLSSFCIQKRMELSRSNEDILKAFVDFEKPTLISVITSADLQSYPTVEAVSHIDLNQKIGTANVPPDISGLPLTHEIQGGELRLEDIPYDAISPEPAGGDFYDSDTDSYLSLSIDEDDGRDVLKKYKFRKVLVPSQESLLAMDLHDGENELAFEIESGPAIRAQLFVWPETSKVVVIDIEGAITVTKTTGGMFGMFLPPKVLVHSGVASMLNSIAARGYKILYIAQRSASSQYSKDHLVTIGQGTDCALPPGPIFQSPESLIRGFGANRTDLFKAAALRGLKGLFPPSHNPYYACFCTKLQDTVAFSRYGITDGRIFIVNELGGISNLNRTFRRTFDDLTESIDLMFPFLSESNPVSGNSHPDGHVDDSFSDFNFWRTPLPQILS